PSCCARSWSGWTGCRSCAAPWACRRSRPASVSASSSARSTSGSCTLPVATRGNSLYNSSHETGMPSAAVPMQLTEPSPDALVSFSDFLLDRFGLVASMQVALLASVAAHALVIVGVSIRPPSILRWDAPHNVMDVVLVNARSTTKPLKADALAQANLDGGGNTDQKLRARSPFPSVETKNDPSRELKAAEARVKQLEAEAKQLMTQMQSKAMVAQVQPAPQETAKPDAQARDLIERSLEIERLEAQIRREHQAYQERPKKKFVGARAEE